MTSAEYEDLARQQLGFALHAAERDVSYHVAAAQVYALLMLAAKLPDIVEDDERPA